MQNEKEEIIYPPAKQKVGRNDGKEEPRVMLLDQWVGRDCTLAAGGMKIDAKCSVPGGNGERSSRFGQGRRRMGDR